MGNVTVGLSTANTSTTLELLSRLMRLLTLSLTLVISTGGIMSVATMEICLNLGLRTATTFLFLMAARRLTRRIEVVENRSWRDYFGLLFYPLIFNFKILIIFINLLKVKHNFCS